MTYQSLSVQEQEEDPKMIIIDSDSSVETISKSDEEAVESDTEFVTNGRKYADGSNTSQTSETVQPKRKRMFASAVHAFDQWKNSQQAPTSISIRQIRQQDRAVRTESASTVNASDQSKKSQQAQARSRQIRQQDSAERKNFASIVHASDRLKKFRKEQAKIDRKNPQASRPPHPPFNKSFLTEENRFRFDLFRRKGVVDQRLVDVGSFSGLGIEKILMDNHLLATVTCLEPYVLEVVMEFYANLPTKGNTNKVFVRGKMYEFSPKLINSVLDLPVRRKETWIDADVDLNAIAATLSGGRVKDWKKITIVDLTPTLAALHVISCANWIPTSDTSTSLTVDRARFLYKLVKKIPFDFGELVYDQVLRVGQTVEYSESRPVFPNLIYQILSYQRDVPLHKGEALSNLSMPICNNMRLCSDKHVSSSSLPSPSGRKGKNVSLPLTSGRKKKLKAYVDMAIACLEVVNDDLQGDMSDEDGDVMLEHNEGIGVATS